MPHAAPVPAVLGAVEEDDAGGRGGRDGEVPALPSALHVGDFDDPGLATVVGDVPGEATSTL